MGCFFKCSFFNENLVVYDANNLIILCLVVYIDGCTIKMYDRFCDLRNHIDRHFLGGVAQLARAYGSYP